MDHALPLGEAGVGGAGDGFTGASGMYGSSASSAYVGSSYRGASPMDYYSGVGCTTLSSL